MVELSKEEAKAPLLDPPSFEEVKAEEMTAWIINKFEPYIRGLQENGKLKRGNKKVTDMWGTEVDVKGEKDEEGNLTGLGVHKNANDQEITAYWYKD